jgi:hypothetical protein
MRSLRGIAVGAVIVAALAGCNGEETAAAPNSSPSASQSETPSPTASATATRPAPTPPAEASEHTDLGAIAFAKHFVEVLNYTAASGDTSQLSAISSTRCTTCRQIIELTREAYANGGYIRGRGWTVMTQSVFRPGSSGMRIVRLDVDTAAQTVKRSSEEPAARVERGHGAVSIRLQPSGASWTVMAMERVAS